MWTIHRSRAGEEARLYEIWHEAVRATHGFLAEKDFVVYARLVREEMLPSASFWIAAGGDGRAAGFMHLEGNRIEALFVDPACHGRGVGRALVEQAAGLSPVLELEVNEQSGAASFYRRLGFVETGRSPVDGLGKPYPLLRMRRG